jgi:hypothetical protein
LSCLKGVAVSLTSRPFMAFPRQSSRLPLTRPGLTATGADLLPSPMNSTFSISHKPLLSLVFLNSRVHSLPISNPAPFPSPLPMPLRAPPIRVTRCFTSSPTSKPSGVRWALHAPSNPSCFRSRWVSSSSRLSFSSTPARYGSGPAVYVVVSHSIHRPFKFRDKCHVFYLYN